MSKFPYINPVDKPKRLEELSRSKQEDFVFDLINAFALVKDPLSSSLLIQDLLTASEIKNISKRLRIAKLLLKDNTYDEIREDLRCSDATIAKVNAWLNEAGDGLKQVIKKLPKKSKRYTMKKGILGHYALPMVFVTSFLNRLESTERKRVENLLNNAKKKEQIFKAIQEAVGEEYTEKTKRRRKIKLEQSLINS
jgi:TrpR-related protein YerC/YecD